MKDYISDNLRRTEILARLVNKDTLTLLDLALEYNVSEVTINRDLSFFRSEGFQIFSRQKRLSLATIPESKQLTGYLAEYLAFKLNRRLLLDRLNAVESAIIENFFQIATLCAKAVDEKRMLQFVYRRITDGVENTYTVKPHELKQNDFNWFIIAVKEGEEIEKIFYLSRIRKINLLEETFKPGNEKNADKILPVELKFTASCRNSLYSKIWFPDFELTEHSDGTITLKTNCAINKRIASWCLRWEGNIRVIGPQELKLKIKSMTEAFFEANNL